MAWIRSLAHSISSADAEIRSPGVTALEAVRSGTEGQEQLEVDEGEEREERSKKKKTAAAAAERTSTGTDITTPFDGASRAIVVLKIYLSSLEHHMIL